VRNEILSSAPKANLLKYVLTRVEGALTGDLLRWTKQPTSVDQFAPKNPSDDSDWYDLIAPAKVGVDQKSYGEYSQMWGNQTLIEFDLHGSLKHTSWSKKVQGLLEHKGLKESHVDMNADVCTKDRWTKDLIVKRTEWMAEAVALITSVAAAQNDKVRIQSFS
jgi:hypothetical protein